MESQAVENSSDRHEKLFALQLKCLSFVGFSRSHSMKFPIAFQLMHMVNFLFVAFAVFTELSFVVLNFDNVLDSAEAFGPLSTEFITMAKLLTFIWYEKEFYELMDKIQTLPYAEESLYVKRSNRFDQRVALTYLSSGIFTGLVLCIAPVSVDIITAWFFGADFKREMPVKSVLPYDSTLSPAYEITYLVYCCATYVTVIQSVAIDSLFFGLSLNICAHFDMLRKSPQADTKAFIHKHQILLELASTVNEIYMFVVLVQFFMSSTLLCVIGFQFVMQDDFIKKAFASSFGLSIIIQFFIYCYGGQIMRDKSSEVADLLYENDKDLVVVIARAQRAAKIKVGFFDACLPTFSAVLSSAASLITLLKSFLE